MTKENRISTSGRVVDETGPSPDPELDPVTRQHKGYWVLSPEEISKGFVRPVRISYIHKTCQVETKMGTSIAETYARDPKFYTQTFCISCKNHFPVTEFVWSGTNIIVGE